MAPQPPDVTLENIKGLPEEMTHSMQAGEQLMLASNVRLVLHSPDPRLQPLLVSALRPEFSVQLETDRERIKSMVRQREAEVLVVDFDSNYSALEDQLAFYTEIGDTGVPIVVMTDDLRRSTAIEFLQRGAYDCIRKPPSIPEFRVVVRRAHEHGLLKRQLASTRLAVEAAQRCDQLIGTSGRAQVVYSLIRRVANLNPSVLITGESGTGKELVARAIHNLGNRADRPFVAVSCGAIPETLIEAELFGHERGAFTGSNGPRAGFLEQAGDGTLFLDEIGELSPFTQVKLLRVLQEREFCRLGSSRAMPLNARVVFATHRNLAQMVAAGTFRRDLYFRLRVVEIFVPPLRERTEDIPTLAHHFLRKYSEEYGKAVHDIRPNVMELLVEYNWPGNIRELENVVQGALILADGDSITRADLTEQMQQMGGEAEESFAPGTFDELVYQFKVNLANKAVIECHGNKTLAARRLRVSRAYVHRLIRRGPEEADAA